MKMNKRDREVRKLAERALRLAARHQVVEAEQAVVKQQLDAILENDEVLQFGPVRVSKYHVDDGYVERHYRAGGWRVKVTRSSKAPVAA